MTERRRGTTHGQVRARQNPEAIATDHCVQATALDAARAGLATTVRLPLTTGVAQATVDSALVELRRAGISLVGEPRMGG